MAETVTGTTGDDLLTIQSDTTTVEGGDGIDTLILEGSSDVHTITLSEDGFVINGRDGLRIISINSVEKIQYSDSLTFLDKDVSNEFQVNSYTSSNQSAPTITALSDGGFVVAWHSDGQDGNGYGIYAQRYDSSGNAAGGEFQVNTYTNIDQQYPTITALSDGGFVVSWQSWEQDGQNYGIYAQRYDASGVTDGVVLHNQSPIIASAVDDIVINEDSVFFLGLGSVFSAPESPMDTHSYEVTLTDGSELPAWLYWNARTEVLGGRPGDDDVGQININYTATDSGGLQTTDTFSITVKDISYGTSDNDQLTIQSNTTTVFGEGGMDTVIVEGDYTDFTVTQSDNMMTLLSDLRATPVYLQDISLRSIERLQFNDAEVNITKLNGGEFHVNSYVSGDQSTPASVLLRDGGYVVVWQSSGQDGDSYGIYGQLYSYQGEMVGDEFRINSNTQSHQESPAVDALDGGGFVVAWQSNDVGGNGYDIYAQRFDASGTQLGDEFVVNSYVDGSQSNPTVSGVEGGGFIVSWQSNHQDGSGQGLFAQHFDVNGSAVGEEFQVNSHSYSHQQNPDSAMLNGERYVVVWESLNQDGDLYGVYAQLYGSSGESIGDAIQVNTGVEGAQRSPSVTPFDNGFVVVWESYNYVTSSYDVVAQVFTENGEVAGDEFIVNSSLSASQVVPDVTQLITGGFVVTWSGGSGDDSTSIYAQIYDEQGAPSGGEVRVNTYLTNNQTNPAVNPLSDGGFVISWESFGQDKDDSNYQSGIYSQIFDVNGVSISNEFQVNSYTSSYQQYPTITALSDGGFVVAWQSDGQDGNGYGIYAQRYDGDGNRIGSEFQANTYVTSTQYAPVITALNNGGFVIGWQSTGQDEFGSGVYGQRFDDSGNRVGDEFNINSFVIGEQYQLDLAAYGNNDFIATWQSNGEIFAQVFDGDGTRLSTNSLYAPPVLVAAIADQTTDEYSSYSYDASSHFRDIISDIPLSYSATLEYGVALPEWLTIDDSTGVVSGIPVNGSAGAVELTVSATDFAGESVSDSYTLTINHTELSTVTEDDASTTLSGQLSGSGASYRIVNQAGTYGALAIDQSGGWNYTLNNSNAATDALAEGVTVTDAFIAVITDSGGGTSSEAVTVAVSGSNDAPVITSSSSFDAPENGTFAGSVVATDADSATVTYSISGGADAALFGIDSSSGALTFNQTPDYELLDPVAADNSYSVDISATDDGGVAVTQSVTVNVFDVGGAPIISSPNAVAVDENTTTVTNLTASDDEGDQIAFTITGGADQNDFTLNGSVLQFKSAPDYELKSSYAVTVTATESATSGGGPIASPNSSEQSITITVNDTDETLTASNESPFSLQAEVISSVESSVEVNGSDISTGPVEPIIKLTLSADMGRITDESISSLTAAEIGLNLDWADYESITYSDYSQESYEEKSYTSNFFNTKSNSSTGEIEKVVVASLDLSSVPSLVLVDDVVTDGQGETDHPSALELGAIYLNPIDTVEGVTISYDGTVTANQGVVEFAQSSQTLEIDTTPTDAIIRVGENQLLDNVSLTYFNNGADTGIATPVDTGEVWLHQSSEVDSVRLSASDAYNFDINISDAIDVLRHIVNLENLSEGSAGYLAADVNNDGTINISDAISILRHIVALEEIDTFDLVADNGSTVTELDSNRAGVAEEWTLVANGDVNLSGSFADDYVVQSELV